MYAYLLFRKKANAHTPKGMDYITNTLGKLSLIKSSRVNNQLARLPFCKHFRNMEYSRAKIDLINMAAVWFGIKGLFYRLKLHLSKTSPSGRTIKIIKIIEW